ncbi:MAG: hypothetical protein ACJ8KU_04595 [Chthoniobacterales bacterium]
MATRKKSGRENVAGSVENAPGLTSGRTTQERRIGSGNLRSGQGARQREVDARPTGRTRTTKRPSSR